MSLFDKVVYHPDTTLVDIGPGLLWDPGVYDQLVPKYHRNVVGATSCPGVGVAGFNLGGGYGNKANQFGLAIDTIKAIEVVLPDGEVRTVSETSGGDIFWALKGGGNNFGIVTKWTMETHPQGDIWFLALNYDQQYFDQVQAAIWAYIQKQVPKSNVETRFEWTPANGNEFKVAAVCHAELFYDGPGPPEDLFKEFLEIPVIVQQKAENGTWKEMMECLPNLRQTYRMGWGSNGTDQPVNDLPDSFRGRYTCVMLSRYTPAFMKWVVELAEEVSKALKSHGGLQFYHNIWPLSPTMFENSPPSAWPHGPDTAFFPLPIRCLWQGKEDDKYWLDTLAAVTEKVRRYAIEQGCTTDGAPVYYNLALDGTDVSLIYRENLPRLVDIRARYDRLGVMNRTGGFRIPLEQPLL
uniref:FAD-binding protein n=1 Tax=Volvariella volvacea TaxID=36659 RepID=M9Z552_9AGAR|nr:FAD-binding protein [Volvariella volvacea]